MIINWYDAHSNTESHETINPYTGNKVFYNQCRNCGKQTKFKPTREMQIIGNCLQRIVICECKKLFIEDLHNK